MYKFLIVKPKAGDPVDPAIKPADLILPDPEKCSMIEQKIHTAAMNNEIVKTIVLSPSRPKGLKYNKIS